MSQETHAIPLVGMFFHPPAKAVIPLLPLSTPLILEPEPTNAYDGYAVRVLVVPSAIPQEAHAALTEALPQWGMELEEILGQESIFLGYVARTHSAAVTAAIQEGPHWSAALGQSADGKPLVMLTLEEATP